MSTFLPTGLWTNTAAGKMRLCSDGVIEVVISPLADQTPEIAGANLRAAIDLRGGIRRAIMIDLRGTKPLSPETRQVYTHKSIADSFSRLALVVDATPMALLMGNVYFFVAKLGIPMKLFEAPEEARDWLLTLD